MNYNPTPARCNYAARIVETAVQPVGSDVSGQICGASIPIQGRIRAAFLRRDPKGLYRVIIEPIAERAPLLESRLVYPDIDISAKLSSIAFIVRKLWIALLLEQK
jgi:hypothetical protein